MPRQVDHGQRRLQIARAVWSVMATRGLDAVSLRSVAAEAGISMGRVQHYFRSKDAMILHACEAMAQAAHDQALGAQPADGAGDGGGADGGDGGSTGGDGDGSTDGGDGAGSPTDEPSPLRVVRSILLTGLPHDEAHRLGAGVWFSFVTKAAVWPELAAVVRSQLDGAHELVSTLLDDAAAMGALRHGVDPATEAVALLAMADGLVLRVMAGALDPQTAVDAIDAHLDQVFARDATTRAGAHRRE